MTSGDDSWAGDRAARWVRQSTGLERQLAPVQDLLLAAAALRPGQAVLDVGCGTGPTTRAAAGAVGPQGRVTGLDVAPEMLAAAAQGGSGRIDWVAADATTWAGADGFDAVVSRFGVMFFADPSAAFANLARRARPGGRLAVAVWGRRDLSPLFEVPLQAALAVVGGDVEIPAVDAGPFSLGDVPATERLLAAAGWDQPLTVPCDVDLPFGGGLAPAEAADVALDVGPTRVVTAGLAPDGRAAAASAVEAAFRARTDEAGHVVLRARVHLVTAVRR